LTANASPASALYITELMALNSATVTDEDGTFSDWLEIHNEGGSAADLTGYYLTDDDELLTKWQFPSVSIPAGGYLLVWASNKNRTNPLLPLHTNFALGGSGEYLALVAPDGATVVHAYAPQFPQQTADRSYGLAGDLTTERCFVDPTPGAANDESTACNLVADVQFSSSRGFYDAPFSVALSTPTSGATIHYTLDGSDPTPTHGTAYSAPIPVATTTMLRAMAFLDGSLATPSMTHTYIFLDDVLQQTTASQPPEYLFSLADYDMDPEVVGNPAYAGTIKDDLKSIPTLSIVTDVDHLFGPENGIYVHRTGRGVAWERPTSVELVRTDGGANVQINCGIRIQGGVSRLSKIGKYSFRLLFKSIYGPSKLNYPLFPGSPVESFDTVTLTAGHNKTWAAGGADAQYIQDTWVKDSQLDMGQAASHSTYVHLYLNGRYWGLYRPTERPDASFLASYYGGIKEDYDALNTSEAIDGDRTAWETMQALANAGLEVPGNYAALLEYVDEDNLIDYMMVNIFAGNYDWPDQNWYAGRLRQAGAGFRFFSWDAELTLDAIKGNRVAVSAFDSPASVYDNLRRENEEFRVAFGDHVHRHLLNGGALTPNANIARWMKRAAEIDRAVVGESARWGDRAREVPYTRDIEWLVEQRWLTLAYFPARTRIVLEQFRDHDLYPEVEAPAFNQNGGDFFSGFVLEMSAPAGLIYYTDDGSDPRLPGGAVAPAAQVYSSGLTLTDAVMIRARARVGMEWSALQEAAFTPDFSLRITEIMYNPTGGTEFEYLELQNIGTSAIDLADVSLGEGVDFVFPSTMLASGAHVLVVNDVAQFTSVHGPGLPVLGEFAGNLSNGGERLTLASATAGLIQDFEFDDAWHPLTDGPGRSLVIRDPAGDKALWGDSAGWRASAAGGGTPGVQEPALCGNGIDDDGDAAVDLADPGCGSADQDEEDPECDDGVDNDGDIDIDLADVHCTDAFVDSEAPGAGDSFLCYRTVANDVAPPFTPSALELSDEFEAGVTFEVSKAQTLCLAGSLNAAGVFDPATHLQAYGISEGAAEPSHNPQPELRYEGGLGPIYIGTVRPERLLVPAAVDPAMPVSAPIEAGHQVDHYKCYRTRAPTNRPRYFPSKAMVNLSDVLESRDYVLKQPRHLCTPVSVDGSEIKTPGRHLICYPAKRDKYSRLHVPALGLHTANHLETSRFDTVREEELCVPSVLVP
jgi:hypothetical protein